MNTKVNEGKLISGKEAKLAWASGEDIELCYKQHEEENTWFLLLSTDPLSTFDRDDVKFRLKPRTITINGIEVPAPFEPKNGEDFYYLDCTSDNYGGWAKTSWRNVESDSFKNNTVFGAWRTEEEIKQVVAALRQVFGGSHDN